MKIVLVNPQIPQNTGNIVRTCAATGCDLILIPPLGFSLSDRYLKRAGLDYWSGVDVSTVDDFHSMVENTDSNFYFFSSKASKHYTSVSYTSDDILVFGSETTGLPPYFHELWHDRFYRIPMASSARCLNLSNSVAIVVYEAWRQNSFRSSL